MKKEKAKQEEATETVATQDVKTAKKAVENNGKKADVNVNATTNDGSKEWAKAAKAGAEAAPKVAEEIKEMKKNQNDFDASVNKDFLDAHEKVDNNPNLSPDERKARHEDLTKNQERQRQYADNKDKRKTVVKVVCFVIVGCLGGFAIWKFGGKQPAQPTKVAA